MMENIQNYNGTTCGVFIGMTSKCQVLVTFDVSVSVLGFF